MDLDYADPAQHVTTAGESDLSDLDHDLAIDAAANIWAPTGSTSSMHASFQVLTPCFQYRDEKKKKTQREITIHHYKTETPPRTTKRTQLDD